MNLSTALVPLITPQRPPIIIHSSGASVFICVHDEFYRGELKRLKQLVLDTHPDRRHFTKMSFGRTQAYGKGVLKRTRYLRCPNATTTFRFAKEALKRFIEVESKWYRQFNLSLPKEVRNGSGV